MNITHNLYKCTANKNLMIDYVYTYDGEGGKFRPNIQQLESGNIILRSYFGLSISEGYNKNKIWISSRQYFTFVSLLKKTTSLITKNLYKLYPNIGGATFEIDQNMRERFMNENSLYANSITMQPSIWVDKTDQPYPAIQVEIVNGSMMIPFEDALGIVEMFRCFDPYSFGVNLLRLLGKVE